MPLSLITREESSKRDSRRVTTDSATSNVGDVEGGDAELFEDGEVFFGVEGGGLEEGEGEGHYFVGAAELGRE